MGLPAGYVVGGADVGGLIRQHCAGLVRHVGISEEEERGLRGWEIKDSGLVAEKNAAVSDPTAVVEDAQTVEGGFLGVHRHRGVEALLLGFRCKQRPGGECACPD